MLACLLVNGRLSSTPKLSSFFPKSLVKAKLLLVTSRARAEVLSDLQSLFPSIFQHLKYSPELSKAELKLIQGVPTSFGFKCYKYA